MAAKLIACFRDVEKGRISMGGVDITQIPFAALMDRISYVSQDAYLSHAPIRENIRVGRPDATDEEVKQTAAHAVCGAFVDELPEGYQTSGGQKQRLSMARALLKGAPIILLDKATASIDPENEKYIQEALRDLVREKTLVVIAHRLFTIKSADQFLVIEDGELREKKPTPS